MPVRQPRHGLARALSKRGLCSRSVAAGWIIAGRVRVDGRPVLDPEFPTNAHSRIEVSGLPIAEPVAPGQRRVLLLNKPRGLVCTRSDERGRATVYQCLDDPTLPWLAPVGRLDQASEGLLLFCNDPQWAASLLGPDSGLAKTYHVQIDRVADATLLARLRTGISEGGEWLRCESVEILRQGTRTSWLQFVLHGGRNRQLRRMLAVCDSAVLRLLRVGFGPLPLGTLAKGQWRWLDAAEVQGLEQAAQRM